MKNQKYIYSIAALIVIGAVFAYVREQDSSRNNSAPSGETEAQDKTATEASPSETTGVPKPPRNDTFFTYEQIVEQYVGRRIQFDTKCVAIPNNVTYKNGTKLMFDNRSPQKRTIALDNTKYVIGPNGFITVAVSSKTLPHTVFVACDSKYNVAQILLQK